MPQNTITYKLLIACPSDIVEEREIIADVTNRINSASIRFEEGYTIQPQFYKMDSFPTHKSTQENINHQLLDNCDIIIAIFWSKLGTPTSVAESGTVEEIERGIEKEKEVAIYFSEKPVPIDHDQDQLKRLKEYRNKLAQNEPKIDTRPFKDNNDFEKQLREHLASLIKTLHGSTSLDSTVNTKKENISKKEKTDKFKGKIVKNTFTNNFFGFSLKTLDDWHIAPEATIDFIKETQVIDFGGGDPEIERRWRFLMSKSYYLFMCSRYPFGDDRLNANFICIVENISHLPIIQTGEDYLKNTMEILYMDGDVFEIADDIKSFKIGKHTFHAFELTDTLTGICQIQFATVIKGYALNFCAGFFEEREFDMLQKIIQTIRFN